MEDRRVADYFVVAGLPAVPEPLDDNALSDAGHLKTSYSQAPITDIGVIFPSLNETPPDDYEVITRTPTGLSADLNHGSLRSIECFICFRRGRDKPPLIDIGVMYDGKERLMPDAEVVKESVGQRLANVNNSSSNTFITFRRGSATLPCNALVVTEICVVIASRGESPPHAFCCIDKNLNKGIVGSDVFLCYKKSMNRAKLLTYKPAALYRYPMHDLPHFPYPSSVPLFCLPMGATLEMWPEEAAKPRPVFSTFILTVSDAKHKVYGSAVTFYEPFDNEQLNDEQRELLGYESDSTFVLYVNKSICVLSHWPFLDAFEKWLLFLYHMVASKEPQTVPIERYIVQLMDEVPFPSPHTLLQLTIPTAADRVIFTQPEDLPLPHSAAGFRQLLLNLGAENSLKVLLLALTEQKILIHSLRPDTLTAVAEAVSTLLFPFKWQCPYIPLCPLGLVEILHAPLPFLIGVDSRFFDLYNPPSDVSCVDLDTNNISICESQRQSLNIKLLPKRPAKALRLTLDRLSGQLRKPIQSMREPVEVDLEVEFQRRRKEQLQELEIREAFLKFMAMTLSGYRSYLLPITKAPTVGTTDPQALFQLNDFLKSRDKAHHKFFTLLMRTQMFIRFIEERSFVTDGDQGLTFFDDCIEKMAGDDFDVRVIGPDLLHTSERTVVLLPPEPYQATDETYTYSKFVLNPLMFKTKRNLNLVSLNHVAVIPGSPMARRTKHEIKSAQKLARKCVRRPDSWARCLLGTAHTLYFMSLPSMLALNNGREREILQHAYDLLVRATQLKLVCDEVCYRLMMQLCGEHSRPLLAVKLLLLMKKSGVQPNALTYGLYNRCVLEAQWPAQSSSSQLLWNKLRYVVLGAAHFRWAARTRASRQLSASTEGASSLLDAIDRTSSRMSLDSQHEEVRAHVPISIVRGISNTPDDTTIVAEAATDAATTGTTLEDADMDFVAELGGDDDDDVAAIRAIAELESPTERLRLLTRSESANDANIIDQLQQNVRKCVRTLEFNGNNKSPTKASPRTPVTENDPLGALEQPTEEEEGVTAAASSQHYPSDVASNQLESSARRIAMGEPVLFRNSLQHSATFEGSPPTQSKIHRSETVPASSITSSLVGLGSSLKLGFSRYSPSRLSLRKADLKGTHQIIESALSNLSPSSLTGKKSNELIQGGISSLKSAATTVAKKLDEIKEAISTTSTPVKVAMMGGGDRMGGGDPTEDCESTDGSDAGERHRRISAGSYKGSSVNLRDSDENLVEQLYPVQYETAATSTSTSVANRYELEMVITSGSQCHNCMALLYDEDIMSHWFPEDSNLNTVCQVCSKATVPLLTIAINQPNATTTTTTTCADQQPFSIPYLSPLVLRKELENVLTLEGDRCLALAKFVDEHPIIYWNLVWTFERINVRNHLPNLCVMKRAAESASVDDGGSRQCAHADANGVDDDGGDEVVEEKCLQPVENGLDPLTQELATVEHLTAQVRVNCLWDNPKLHGDCIPMYILWQQTESAATADPTSITKSLMQTIVKSLYCSDLLGPMKRLASERQKMEKLKGTDRTYSIYRDILFLACKAVGRANIDLNTFDKLYAQVFAHLCENNGKLDRRLDYPLSEASAYCRQYFKPLNLA